MKRSGQHAFKIAQEKETEQEKLQERAQVVFERLTIILDEKVTDRNYKKKDFKFERRDYNIGYDEWKIAVKLMAEVAKKDGYVVDLMVLESCPAQYVLKISWDLSKEKVETPWNFETYVIEKK